jgi:hypothetical protein
MGGPVWRDSAAVPLYQSLPQDRVESDRLPKDDAWSYPSVRLATRSLSGRVHASSVEASVAVQSATGGVRAVHRATGGRASAGW